MQRLYALENGQFGSEVRNATNMRQTTQLDL